MPVESAGGTRAGAPPPGPLTGSHDDAARRLAGSIGNRAFTAVVARRTLARNGILGVDDPDSLGSTHPLKPKIDPGSTEALHAAIYGDSSLAHAPGPSLSVLMERDAERLVLLSDADLANELKTYSEDSLRLIDDGGQRALTDAQYTRLSTAIVKQLKAMGVSEGRAKAGQRYGDVEVKVGTVVDGNVATGTNFEYPIELWFKPDPSKIDADEIAWIQTVRNVNPTTGANLSPYGTKRMTDDFTKIDRLTGREQGWYGMFDDQTGGGTLKIWKKGGAEPRAYMTDTPSFGDGPRDFSFESAVVARKGKDAGKVYAVVTWGFTVDANLKVTPKKTRIFNKETSGFNRAVDKWNEQSALKDPADRNAPGQKTLPQLQ